MLRQGLWKTFLIDDDRWTEKLCVRWKNNERTKIPIFRLKEIIFWQPNISGNGEYAMVNSKVVCKNLESTNHYNVVYIVSIPEHVFSKLQFVDLKKLKALRHPLSDS